MMARPRILLASTTVVLLIAAALMVADAQTTTGRQCVMGQRVDSDDPWHGAAISPDPRAQPSFIDIPGQDGEPDGLMGPDEPLYLDADGSGHVNPGDIRWSPGTSSQNKTGGAGHAVEDGDPDIEQPLTTLEAPFMFTDENANGLRDDDESTVIDVDDDGMISAGDRWLAPPERAGEVEGQAIARVGLPLTQLLGNVAFLDADADGNRSSGDRPVWDQADEGNLTTNDVCLSIIALPQTNTTKPTTPGSTTDTAKTTPAPTQRPSPTTSPTGRTPTSTTQLPGGFLQDGDRLEGRYVAFDADVANGRVFNLSVGGIVFLQEIQVDCPCRIEAVRDSNSRPTGLRVETESADLLFHDQPQGLIRVTGPGPVRFVPVETEEVRAADASTRRISADGHVAWLQARSETNDNASVAREGSGLSLVGGGMFFVANPDGLEPLFNRIQPIVEQAVLDRRLAAQVQVLSATGVNEPQVLAYDDVAVIVDEPKELAYRIRIDADLPEGKAFLFQFPQPTLPAKELELTYQSETAPGIFENVTLVRADSLDDALDAASSEPAEYWIDQAPEGFTVAATVPHFSIQIFQVLGIPPETAPIFAYGVVLVFLFLGIATVGALFGRRGRPAWKPGRREISPWWPPRPQA